MVELARAATPTPVKKLALGSALSALLFASFASPASADIVPPAPPWNVAGAFVPPGATWLTGPNSWNMKAGYLGTYQVGGTDLGIPWRDGSGNILIAFGDTFGGASVGAAGWRRGTLARTTDGFTINGMLWEAGSRTNPVEAEQAIAPALLPTSDTGALPTAGFSFGGSDYEHFMAINSFSGCIPGQWSTTYSGFAQHTGSYDTPGLQFTRLQAYASASVWGPLSNFADVAAVPWGNYLYLFGTTAGRTGALKLARAPLGAAALTSHSYQYWDGTTWQANEAAGIYIVPRTVSEPSVQFDVALGRFVMTYLDQTRTQIVMRDAPSIEGPWGAEKVILNAGGNLYGGFMNPMPSNGTSVTLNVSSWSDYNVFQYTTPLAARAQVDDLVADTGFEEGSYLQQNVVGPGWQMTGLANNAPWPNVPPGSAQTPHSGSHAAFMNSNQPATAWQDVHQNLAVTPGKSYELRAWVQGAPNVTQAYVGLRTAGRPVMPASTQDTCLNAFIEDPNDPHTPVHQVGPMTLSSTWTQVYFRFDAGANNLVQIFAGYHGAGGPAWMDVDDVTLTPLEASSDSGFEQQGSSNIGWPFLTEGTSLKGIDLNLGLAHTGQNDAWMRTSAASQWNAVTQVVAVQPNTYYQLQGSTETSPGFGAGYMGVRDVTTNQPFAQLGFVPSACSTASPSCYSQNAIAFNSGARTSVRLFAGYWSPPYAGDTWVRVDDLKLSQLGN